MATATGSTPRTRSAVPTGIWRVDPVHSTVQFAVKHMGIATVRGKLTIISPQLSGYVVEMDVQDFQTVRKGALLLRLDDRIYRQRVEQAGAQLATQRAALANYARYPAVNWFSYYGLARYLRQRGMSCLDRFDLIDRQGAGGARRLVGELVRKFPPARLLGQMMTPGTIVFAVKR